MNNKGVTLIEVVVSLAILAIVVTSVCSFVNIGMNTSTTSTTIANIQKEAQTVQNQLQTWIMEANQGIKCFKDDTNYDQALVIYHDGSEASDRYVQIIYYRGQDKKLYYHKVMTSLSFTGTKEQIKADAASIEAAGTWKEYVFSSYVSEVDIDLSHIESQLVTVNIGYEWKEKSYHTNNTIKLRNAISE